jgi:predicted RNA methylase
VTAMLIDDGHEMDLARLRDYEVDYTPGPVAQQGLAWALRVLSMSYASQRRVLDPSAGAGVFGQQLRPMLHEPFMWAVEPRFEEKGNLKRHYDEVEACAFADADFDDEPFDLIATNPPFSLWTDFLERALDLIHDDGGVLLYGSIAWGQSSEGAKVFEQHRPSNGARIVGRVHHRGPGVNPKTGKPWGADSRDSCWWLWRKRHTPRTWTTENLPELPPEARRWVVKPGTEPTP